MKRYDFAKITVAPYPNICDVNNKWIFAPDITTVVNVSQKVRGDIRAAIVQKGIAYYHFPLDEEVADIGWGNVMEAVKAIEWCLLAGGRVLVHCDGGQHRSRLVVEAYHYAKFGCHIEDEYKEYANHLIYDCFQGFLPALNVVEDELLSMGL